MQTASDIISFEGDLTALSGVGFDPSHPENGRDCLSYTENEDEAHRVFGSIVKGMQNEAAEKGMALNLEVDPFGNSYAVLCGETDREIMVCSHLDSVPKGGRFDGMVGVTAGIDLIRRIIESGEKLNKTIKVVAFRSEESSVTGHSCLGSALATGSCDEITLGRPHTKLGKSLKEVLGARGVNNKTLHAMKTSPFISGDALDAVIEVHIEQSEVLASLDKPAGIVVNGIGGARRSDLIVGDNVARRNHEGKIFEFVVKGKSGHSGGLPMNGEMILGKKMTLRRDAVVAAVQFLVSKSDGKIGLVDISVPGGNYNTVPEECRFTLAMPNDAKVQSLEGALSEFLPEGMTVEVKEIQPEGEIKMISEDTACAALSIMDQIHTSASGMAVESNGAVRATIGDVKSMPSGEIAMKLDLRRLDNDLGDSLGQAVQALCGKIKVPVREQNIVLSQATPLSSAVAEVMRKAAKKLNLELPEMGSMPGQDAAKIIRAKRLDGSLVPGGMIFVRSLNGGASHCPDELSATQDIKVAIDLLHATVLEMMQ